jgi:DNA-binding MarR family transcriptional regulator
LEQSAISRPSAGYLRSERVTDGRQSATSESGLAEVREQCGRAFDRVAGLTKPHDSEWLSLDLGMGQLKAVVVLVKHRQLTVGGLARALDISEPSASLLVDKIVARGLVTRETDPADRRRTLVVASEQGDLLVERLRRSRQDQLARWLALMDEDDLLALTRGLDALSAVIEQGETI